MIVTVTVEARAGRYKKRCDGVGGEEQSRAGGKMMVVERKKERRDIEERNKKFNTLPWIALPECRRIVVMW